MPADRTQHTPYPYVTPTNVASGPGQDTGFPYPVPSSFPPTYSGIQPPFDGQGTSLAPASLQPPRAKKTVSRPLQRNQACITCRGRKVRCDAVKPGCGACRRSAAAHGEDPDLVTCQYDDEEPGAPDTAPPKPKKASAKIAVLEEKIAELEKLIRDQQISDASSPSSEPSPLVPNSSKPNQPSGHGNGESSTATHNNTAGPSSQIFQTTVGPNVPVTNVESTVQDPVMDLLWPGWPAELPHPNIVTHLTNIYLSRFPNVTSEMIGSGAFRHAMTMPAHSIAFPFIGLIHSMMAVSYLYWGGDSLALQLGHGARYWPAGTSVADYHAACAMRCIDDALGKGQNLFQVSQAINNTCFFAYSAAKFVEVWIYCGFATRIATPLGLNHLEGSFQYQTGAKVRPRALLPPPSTTEEKYRRSVTFWVAFSSDRFASASSGWAHSIDERDISSCLPARPGTSMATVEDVDLETHPLSMSNPHFFTSHPVDVDVFQLELKAIILMGRVTTWLQRSPGQVSCLLAKNFPPTDMPPPDLRMTPDFIKLDQDLSAFRMSIPRRFLDFVTDSGLDQSRVLLCMIPHLSTILLHEPFITWESANPALDRCLNGMRAIVNYAYQLISHNYDFRMLHPFTNFCLAVAGRTLVRLLAIEEARNQGSLAVQNPAGDLINQDIETLLRAMEQTGHILPLGNSVSRGLKEARNRRHLFVPPDRLSATIFDPIGLCDLSDVVGIGIGPDNGNGIPPVPHIPSQFANAVTGMTHDAGPSANSARSNPTAAPSSVASSNHSPSIDFTNVPAWTSLLTSHTQGGGGSTIPSQHGLDAFADLGNHAAFFPSEEELQQLDPRYLDQVLGHTTLFDVNQAQNSLVLDSVINPLPVDGTDSVSSTMVGTIEELQEGSYTH